MRVRYSPRTHTISIHAFTLVLAGILCFSGTPAAHGFIALEHIHDTIPNTLIKKVHRDHWVIHYSYADNCPPEARNNDAVLTAAISKALRTWLQPVKDYTKEPVVDDFRYKLIVVAAWEKAPHPTVVFQGADLGITFACNMHASLARIPPEHVGPPVIDMAAGVHVTEFFMYRLVHEVGHTFGLADTYLSPEYAGKPGLDTGGLDNTWGAQPGSLMSIKLLLFAFKRGHEDAELHGIYPIGEDDKNGIIWLYKHIYENQPLKDCFFPDYEFEASPAGCRPKYPLIFELKYNSPINIGPEWYPIRIIEEDEGLDVNAQDADGMTALHYAVLLELPKVVKELLAQQGILPYLRDNQGRSALKHARDNKLHEMIDLLLLHPLTLPVNAKGKLATTWGHLKKQY